MLERRTANLRKPSRDAGNYELVITGWFSKIERNELWIFAIINRKDVYRGIFEGFDVERQRSTPSCNLAFLELVIGQSL
jgi:hypothetical protein